jgi:DNA-binding response OmpR family regulator
LAACLLIDNRELLIRLKGGPRLRRKMATLPKIAVLDDEPMIREIIGHVARSCGFETFDTGSPEDFEARIRMDPPQVVILDLLMPELDGIEVLRKLSAQMVDIPILLVSGMDNRLLESARQLGEARGLTMAGVIQKPFRVEELKAKLEKAIAGAGELTGAMLENASRATSSTFIFNPFWISARAASSARKCWPAGSIRSAA